MEKYDRQNDPQLIGYGLFSLVFRPPFALPDPYLSPDLRDAIEREPYRFIGLVTTHKHYRRKIRQSTELLKQLSLKHPDFSRLVVLPCALAHEDFCVLSDACVQELVEKYHAVRKKVEYEETWKQEQLIQMIYPYAGIPLAQFCKKPQGAPTWEKFCQGMVDIAAFLLSLHNEGYVHGDPSPNNLLYEQTDGKNGTFTIVDWNMLGKAESFLEHRKGYKRVGCWSPEHFSLTTVRLKEVEEDHHWMIYAEEMRKYMERLLNFSFSSGSSKGEKAIREYLGPHTGDHAAFQAMYADLKILARTNPSAIGKYHDIRYFMDTIAKCVSYIFPNRTATQQNQYNFFISLCLVQNLPERKVYLDDPDRLANRLLVILQACQNAERERVPSHESIHPGLEAEQSLLNLLL